MEEFRIVKLVSPKFATGAIILSTRVDIFKFAEMAESLSKAGYCESYKILKTFSNIEEGEDYMWHTYENRYCAQAIIN